MSTATLAGHRVISARANLPAWGVWYVEAAIDEEVNLIGRVPVVVADLVLLGTVISGGPGPKGRSSYRIAAGAGAWGKTIPARSYANDAGVKAATVLADAARACGEAIAPETLPDGRVGPAFTREEGPAGRVLELLAPAGWYVGQDGVTRIGKRPTLPLVTPAAVASVDRARGVVSLAAESVATVVPGVVVEGLEAVDVVHELTASGLRSKLWGRGISATSRRLEAWRRIVDQLDPERRFRGVYEYRVVTQEGERINVQPIRVSIGMPSIERVPVRPGVSGARADLALGSRVLIGFVDSDPARPVVLGFEDAEGEGFFPMRLELDASAELDLGETAVSTKIAGGVLGIARQTDPVVCGGFGGTIVNASLRARCG